ncbi:hypothetical protein KFK09_027202 [Dendrobium nobile]|uniref:Uncharacterized protein n=1 Tax=Dendrobium nobile TaxID=94219 RepID=A0A8T3A8R2_DENNO|nr:hypothetical protein KFK09_027202 [Dendrobium nobile]
MSYKRINRWHQLLINRYIPYLMLAQRIHLKLLHLLDLEKSDVTKNLGKSNVGDDPE